MNAKEYWIKETLHTIETIQRVEVPKELQNALKHVKKIPTKVTRIQIVGLAASVVILVSLNLISIHQYFKKAEELASNEGKNQVYKEYFSNEYQINEYE
ncbi:hypothetical protein [Flavobacterium aciduliphilum]|uniref:Uncharacterized protein n=1 Tax=Flavobacterium aciduliphilum TaxID=1101402 RepID=A0A328Y9Z9_9FLAO|nr:hypothetical protein [Flavobacterium aciduliphilum]RAR70828.1 hypothetical protein CLV55_10979 [Flavobacterium aciduliphilum]